MKKLLALALTLALAALPSWAADVSAAALQGRWLITSVEGEPETVKNYWEFTDSAFRQVQDGKVASDDKYVASGDAIDVGYMKIKVRAFDGKTMEAGMAGFRYTLKKQ